MDKIPLPLWNMSNTAGTVQVPSYTGAQPTSYVAAQVPSYAGTMQSQPHCQCSAESQHQSSCLMDLRMLAYGQPPAEEMAQSFVQFQPSENTDQQGFVPKGTVVESQYHVLAYETTHHLSLSHTQLENVITLHSGTHRCVRLLDAAAGNSPVPFQAFSLQGKNLEEHCLLLGYAGIFDHMENFTLTLTVAASDSHNAETAAKLLMEPSVRFSMDEPAQDGTQQTQPFHNIQRQGNLILLTMEHYQPKKTMLQGHALYVLRIASSQPHNLQLSKLLLSVEESARTPDCVMAQDALQNPAAFMPFGTFPLPYAQCGIESKGVFAKRGALVQLTFDLEFMTIHQPYSEKSVDAPLKMIMKAPPSPPPDPQAAFPYTVMLEYSSHVAGWKSLLSAASCTALFHPAKAGLRTISFPCPVDMAPEGTLPYRMRLRLMPPIDGQSLDSPTLCPVVRNLQLAYSYHHAPLLSVRAEIRNGFVQQDVLPVMQSGQCFTPFQSQQEEGWSMYLGFHGNPAGAPLSLYFEVENPSGTPVPFSVSYLTQAGFIPIEAADHTQGLLYSHTVQLHIPPTGIVKSMFGRTGYWLRFTRLDKGTTAELPTIKRIIPNVVQVQNRRLQEQLFFWEDVSDSGEIQLKSTNIIHADVYVNGKSPPYPDSHWVRWNRQSQGVLEGSVYAIDYANGRVQFAADALIAYAFDEKTPAVRVVFHSHEGSAANLPANTIMQLESPLRCVHQVTNPVDACGGWDEDRADSLTEKIRTTLRTGNRGVTLGDFEDIMLRTSHSLRQVKCAAEVDTSGLPASNTITAALLTDHYEDNRLFPVIAPKVREKLLETTNILPMGKNLLLTAPQFLPCDAGIWVVCAQGCNPTEIEVQIQKAVEVFLHPLTGGFTASGWEIGVLPTTQQLQAFLRKQFPQLHIRHLTLTVTYNAKHYTLDQHQPPIQNPFVMGVNGSHRIHIQPHYT